MSNIPPRPARINTAPPPIWQDAEDDDADPGGQFSDVGRFIDDAPPPEPAPGPGPTVPAYRFAPITSAAFAAADYTPSWLVRNLLVASQPCILGGPKKVLKTSLLVDLALSLGTGTPFLGTFSVDAKTRCILISGESGETALHETALRVCEAKRIDLARADVLWDFRLPQLANAAELAELSRGIRASGATVCIVDPLYLALLAGQGEQGISAASLYDMGPLLLSVADACLRAGATPILAHHAKKTRPNAHVPLDLDDLAFSGVAEFARQWLLLSRREAFKPGTGENHLWLTAGGSIGHSGLWAVDIAEGQLGEDFSGRRWDVSVQLPSDTRAAERESRDEAKVKKQRAKDREDDTAVLLALDRLDPHQEGAATSAIRDSAQLNSASMARAVERLLAEGIIEHIRTTCTIGNGAKRAISGIRRKPIAGTSGHPDRTSGQNVRMYEEHTSGQTLTP